MDAMQHWRENPPAPGESRLDNLDANFAEALLTGAGWVLTQQEMDGVMAACSTDYCRQRVVYFRRQFNQPLQILVVAGMNELMYIRVGPFDLRSPRQLESKIAQFPKGTAFFDFCLPMWGPGGGISARERYARSWTRTA